MEATDRETLKKREELWWVEFTRRNFPGILPDGSVEQPSPPAPDVLIASDRGVVGIEISRMVPEKVGPYVPVQVQALRHAAVNGAQALYQETHGDHLFVNVSFAPGALPAKDLIVQELVSLVANHKPVAGATFAVHANDPLAGKIFPAWLQGLTILHESPRQDARWHGTAVGSVPTLRQEQVLAGIRKKAELIGGYRQSAEEVWLMLVCDQRRISTDVSIPKDADNWRFEHPFDRVLLLSMQEILRF